MNCRRHPCVLVSNSNNIKKWPSRGLFFIWNYTDGFCMLKIHIDLSLKELKFHYGLFLDSQRIQVTVDVRIHKGVKKKSRKLSEKKEFKKPGRSKTKWWEGNTFLFLSRKWMEWNEWPEKDVSGFTNQKKCSEILRYSDFICHLITIKPFVRIV